MERGSIITEVEMGRLQHGLAMSLEAVVYNMAAALNSPGGRGRSPWAVKDQIWIIHELIELVAKHQIDAAKNDEVVAWSRWEVAENSSAIDDNESSN